MTVQRQGAIALTEGGSGSIQPGGIYRFVELLQNLDLGNAAAASGANQDVTVTGLVVGDVPLYVVPAAGLAVGVGVVPLGPVAVANTLRLRVLNPTAAGVDATAADFLVGVLRPT